MKGPAAGRSNGRQAATLAAIGDLFDIVVPDVAAITD
jgi:hypothetical protein